VPAWAPQESDLQAQVSSSARPETRQYVPKPEGRAARAPSGNFAPSGEERDPYRLTQTPSYDTGYGSIYPSNTQEASLQGNGYQSYGTRQPSLPSQITSDSRQRSYSDQQSLAEPLGQLSVSQAPRSHPYSTATQSPRSHSYSTATQSPRSHPYSTATQSPFQQSALPDIRGQQQQVGPNYASLSGYSTDVPSAGQAKATGMFSEAVTSYEHQENQVPSQGRVSSRRPSYPTSAEPRRSSTLATSDPRYTASRHVSRRPGSRAAEVEETIVRDQRPEHTYYSSKDQRTIVTPGARRVYTDASDQPVPRSSRRSPTSVIQAPDEEVEELPERPRE
jgi:hypothetical protein